MAAPTQRTVADLVESFAAAPSDALDSEFRRLAGAVWDDGRPTDLAPQAVRDLIAALDRVEDTRKGYLAVLLGMLVQAEHPATDTPVATAAAQGLKTYLDLWRRTTADQPLRLALLYLVAQFPAARDRVLGVASGLNIDADDASRLDRALRAPDPAGTMMGRMFPYPAVWEELDEAERKADRAWIDALTEDQVTELWHKDTGTILGSIGAKAYWAVRNAAMPAPVVPDAITARDPHPRDSDVGIFRRHADVLRCPRCRGEFVFEQTVARCAGCRTRYPIARGLLNVTANLDDGSDHSEDFLFQLAKTPSMGYFIDKYARPNFKRLCGLNYDDQITPRWEDVYLGEHVRPAGGPVLDLAAGGGRWTQTLANNLGTEQVIAVDLLPSILATLRDRLPAVPAIVANGKSLPVGDSTLGAAVCWNALQAFPADAPGAIAEIGRCLRPGGTFSLFTFYNSDDPIYRNFVGSHQFPQHAGGLHLFELSDLRDWLAKAGLKVVDESGPGLSFIITAVKEGS